MESTLLHIVRIQMSDMSYYVYYFLDHNGNVIRKVEYHD